MGLECIIFVILTVYFSIVAGMIAKLYSKGVRGKTLLLAFPLPWMVFMVGIASLKGILDHLDATADNKFFEAFYFIALTIKGLPIITGMFGLYLHEKNLQNEENNKSNLYAATHSLLYQYYDNLAGA